MDKMMFIVLTMRRTKMLLAN